MLGIEQMGATRRPDQTAFATNEPKGIRARDVVIQRVFVWNARKDPINKI